MLNWLNPPLILYQIMKQTLYVVYIEAKLLCPRKSQKTYLHTTGVRDKMGTFKISAITADGIGPNSDRSFMILL